MTNPSMDSHDAESQPLLGRNDNVNTPLTGHCYTETDADATTPATASPGDHDFDFDPLGDVDNPLEWPIALKWGIVTLLALMAFTVYVYPLSFLLPFFSPLWRCCSTPPPFSLGQYFQSMLPPSPRTAPLHRDPRSGYPWLPPFRGRIRSEHRTEHENHPIHHPPPRCTTLTHDPQPRCFPDPQYTPRRTLPVPLNHQNKYPFFQKNNDANTAPAEHSPVSPPSPLPRKSPPPSPPRTLPPPNPRPSSSSPSGN